MEWVIYHRKGKEQNFIDIQNKRKSQNTKAHSFYPPMYMVIPKAESA